jgi:hypothetical protein
LSYNQFSIEDVLDRFTRHDFVAFIVPDRGAADPLWDATLSVRVF